MKVSDLILELQEFYQVYGDLEVFAFAQAHTEAGKAVNIPLKTVIVVRQRHPTVPGANLLEGANVCVVRS